VTSTNLPPADLAETPPTSGFARWSTGATPLAPHIPPSRMEPIKTWANLITVIRSLAALILGVIGAVNGSLMLLAIGYLVYWIGDSADGNVARFLKQETRQGAVFDIICDRANACVLAIGYMAYDPGVSVPLAVYLLQFMVIDMVLTLSFLFWPLVSPNYFNRVDRPVFLLNWSKTAKTANTTVVVTLTALGWIIPATVVASIVLLMKVWSLHRVIGILTGRTAPVA
jgi:CDP-diacylglycerol--glycerol-3-phosphate 3-phosphatidyltransferase